MGITLLLWMFLGATRQKKSAPNKPVWKARLGDETKASIGDAVRV
jgi:hypothetical protein